MNINQPGSAPTTIVRIADVTGANANVQSTYKSKIVAPNIVNGVNTLMQTMINETNVKYIFRYDFTLGEDITIPADCVLEFDGGSIGGAYTLTGSSTNVKSTSNNIFKDNIVISGDWKVDYVLLDWFGPDTNGYYNSAFINALRMSTLIHCVHKKVYNFSGETIDCRAMGGSSKLHIIGNDCSFSKFYFAYDIKSDGNPHTIAAIPTFKYIIEGINFNGDLQIDKPCLFFSACIEVKRCNFSGYHTCLGFTPRYVDCITLVDIFAGNWDGNDTRMNLVNTYNYDFSESTGGSFTCDWFEINNVHAKTYIKVKQHNCINVMMSNSLHIMFDFVDNNQYNYSIVTLYAVNCHWENSTPIILNNNNFLNSENSFIFEKCYLYSTALPQNSKVMEFVELRNTRICYFNNNNYANIPNLHKSIKTSYTIVFDVSILKYDSSLFENSNILSERIVNGTITPANANSYYFAQKNFTVCPQAVYTNAQNVKYLIAYSTREDVLYNGGNTPTVYWSNDFHIDANKVNSIIIYTNNKPNAFVHIFRKDIDNNTIQHIVFKASWFLMSTGDNNAVAFLDTKLGIFGYPWQEYTGQEEDIRYVSVLP